MGLRQLVDASQLSNRSNESGSRSSIPFIRKLPSSLQQNNKTNQHRNNKNASVIHQQPNTTIKMTIALNFFFKISSLSLLGCKAFLSPSQVVPSFSTSLLQAAKSICTFDETDFAGKTGDWPYLASDLNRLDNSDDQNFYNEPRFVTHIDDAAIGLLTDFYRQEFNSLNLEKVDVLDLCSSWISHLPEDVEYGKVVGVGMNKSELEANKQLTDFVVQDMNQSPDLSQFEDDSFDVICNVVSVDYLTKPLEIFQEMHRLLKPGGLSLMSFSNRCFPTKAIAMWLQADDIGRLTIVASYYHYSASWKTIEAFDLKEIQENPKRPSTEEIFKNPSLGLAWMNAASAVAKNNQGDPMFVVKGVK